MVEKALNQTLFLGGVREGGVGSAMNRGAWLRTRMSQQVSKRLVSGL